MTIDNSTSLGEEVGKDKDEADEAMVVEQTLTMDDEADVAMVAGGKNTLSMRKNPCPKQNSIAVAATSSDLFAATIYESPLRRNFLTIDNSTSLGEEVGKDKDEADEAMVVEQTLTMDDEADVAMVAGGKNTLSMRKNPCPKQNSIAVAATSSDLFAATIYERVEEILCCKGDGKYEQQYVTYKLNISSRLKIDGHSGFVFDLSPTCTTNSRSLSIGIESTDAEPKSWILTSGNPERVLPGDSIFLPVLMSSVRNFLKIVCSVNLALTQSLQDVSVLVKKNIIFLDESAQEKVFANLLLNGCGWERKKKFILCEL